jgi:hypothetical protein
MNLRLCEVPIEATRLLSVIASTDFFTAVCKDDGSV